MFNENFEKEICIEFGKKSIPFSIVEECVEESPLCERKFDSERGIEPMHPPFTISAEQIDLKETKSA